MAKLHLLLFVVNSVLAVRDLLDGAGLFADTDTFNKTWTREFIDDCEGGCDYETKVM